MLNVVVLAGRLTRDPDLKYSASGKAICAFRLAVDRGTNGPDGSKQVDFIDCVCFEKTAENVSNYLQKGRLVAVNGRLQIRQWTADDGNKREKAEVVANSVRFLDKGTDTAGERSAPKAASGMGSEPKFTDDDDSVPF